MAESGGQPGNRNAVKSKRWYQAIDRALDKRSKAAGIEALDELAERLLKNAEAGDIAALRELGDRLDGKAAQAMTLKGDEDNPLTIRTIERVIVDASDK